MGPPSAVDGGCRYFGHLALVHHLFLVMNDLFHLVMDLAEEKLALLAGQLTEVNLAGQPAVIADFDRLDVGHGPDGDLDLLLVFVRNAVLNQVDRDLTGA